MFYRQAYNVSEMKTYNWSTMFKINLRDIEIALVCHPSNNGITIKISNGVDVLLHRPASHPIFSYCVG